MTWMDLLSRRARVAFITVDLAFMAVALSPQVAHAVTFTPVQPPTCPTTTNFNWNLRVGGQTGVFDLPSDPNCSDNVDPCRVQGG